MVLNKLLESKSFDPNKPIYHRDAVRAVIFKDGKLLMIRNKEGNYIFPGGGINKDESIEKALVREVLEEAGYQVSEIKEYLGMMTERRLDRFNSGINFEMISHYYLCNVSEEVLSQKLEDYEAELGYEPTWATLDEIIMTKERLLRLSNPVMEYQVGELQVIRLIKNHLLHVQ